MDERIEIIKKWLGTGSINIFGMPFSGKDTIGIRLAEILGAKFLSSGLILRAAEKEDKELQNEMANGKLANTDKFRSIVLPYLAKSEFSDYPLILSSVGRWEGEEITTLEAAEKAGHPIKAAMILNLSETETKERWKASKSLQDRGERLDDKDEQVLENRIEEFNTKTKPVIETYQKRGLVVPVKATGTREEVFSNAIDSLMHIALSKERSTPIMNDENQEIHEISLHDNEENDADESEDE